MRPLVYKLILAIVASSAVIAANTFDQDAILAVAFMAAYFIIRIELLQAAISGSLAASLALMSQMAEIEEADEADYLEPREQGRSLNSDLFRSHAQRRGR